MDLEAETGQKKHQPDNQAQRGLAAISDRRGNRIEARRSDEAVDHRATVKQHA